MKRNKITSVTMPRELRITNYARTAIVTNHNHVKVYQLTRASQRRVKRIALNDNLNKRYESFRVITA